MNRSNTNWLIAIIVLLVISLVIDLRNEISLANPSTGEPWFSRSVETKLGLDLRGGLQALLEADVADCNSVNADELNVTRNILQSRANGLGVSEVIMQSAGACRIVAEFPGASNPDDVVKALQQTGLLEFVDMGSSPVTDGTVIQTDYDKSSSTSSTATATPGSTPEVGATSTAVPDASATPAPTATAQASTQVYHTVMTGAALSTVNVTSDTLGQPQISFVLKSDSTKLFADYTTAHVNQYLAIVLDKKVLSAPVIKNAITDGQGVIQGNYTAESANTLAVQLRYGALPIPIKVVSHSTVGATLGEESVRKSLMAGAIGLAVVIVFMLLYYRLPGFIADLALITYALLSLALFKLIPVVLTLPGIAGFILSIGMAVDANILIFERLKEELRAGRNLRQAIDLGWSRAWPSIRDSNISTLITCLILLFFGSRFGASMVKGFSINLGLGVLISLFTAVIVTRTFLHTVLDNIKMEDHPRWFGL